MKKQAVITIPVIVLIVLVTIVPSSAQNETQDIIYLKNGSLIKGRLLDREDRTEDYMIQLENGKTISIEAIHVEKIGQKEISPEETLLVEPVFSRWWTLFEPGVAFGLGDLEYEGSVLENRGIYPGFRVVNSFMLGRSTSMGIGIGYQNYAYGNMMPVFLDFRAYVGKKQPMPMALINAGYSFGWPKDDDDPEWAGVFINPALGAVFKLPAGTAFFLSLGYRLQRIRYAVSNDLETINTTYLSLRLGVIF